MLSAPVARAVAERFDGDAGSGSPSFDGALAPASFTARMRMPFVAFRILSDSVHDVVPAALPAISVQSLPYVPPARAWYCHCVTDASFGSVHDSSRSYFVPFADSDSDSPTGFAGIGTGVADFSPEASPSPARFRARTWNAYVVRFVSCATVCAVVDAPLLGTAVHAP